MLSARTILACALFAALLLVTSAMPHGTTPVVRPWSSRLNARIVRPDALSTYERRTPGLLADGGEEAFSAIEHEADGLVSGATSDATAGAGTKVKPSRFRKIWNAMKDIGKLNPISAKYTGTSGAKLAGKLP